MVTAWFLPPGARRLRAPHPDSIRSLQPLQPLQPSSLPSRSSCRAPPEMGKAKLQPRGSDQPLFEADDIEELFGGAEAQAGLRSAGLDSA